MTTSVLLVDDDPDIRELIATLLAARGYEVTTASNGLEALESLRRASMLPALILLDVMMPKMDGWAFRAAQVRNERLAAIPVVLLSASSDVDQLALERGMTGSVRKPFGLKELLAAVRRHSKH